MLNLLTDLVQVGLVDGGNVQTTLARLGRKKGRTMQGITFGPPQPRSLADVRSEARSFIAFVAKHDSPLSFREALYLYRCKMRGHSAFLRCKAVSTDAPSGQPP